MTEERRNTGKRGRTIRFLRRLTQAVVLVAFVVLLIFAADVTESGRLADIFLRISPLAAVTTMLGSGTLIARYWPALVAVVLAMALGRFFCGWICPLGTTIDLSDKLLRKARRKRPWLYDGRRLKYYLLAFLVLGSIFGVQMSGWFDPLSIATRSYGVVIHPMANFVVENTLRLLGGLPVVGGFFGGLHDVLRPLLDIRQRGYNQGMAFLVVLLLILSAGLAARRYWCRNLCPVGAVFALFSAFSPFRRKVGDDCIACRKCERGCRMGAIPEPVEGKTPAGKNTLAGECVQCMDCERICPVDVVSFSPGQPAEQREEVDLTRRGLAYTVLGSIAAVPVMRLNFRRARLKGNLTLIRPPGARPEDEFLQRCVRCGECMRVCPNNAIHPAGLEAGIEGLWTPRLIPRIGHCNYECTLCGRACPSGAIAPLTPQQKHETSIGLARFDHDRCIPWIAYRRINDLKKNWVDRNCGTCEEVCPVPTKAIRYEHIDVNGNELRLPYVVEEICVGCGYCEKVCPVSGRAAVRVEGRRTTVEVRKEEAKEVAPLDPFFPENISAWKRGGPPKTYVGRKKLFEYIDGGAEPYLTYSFVQAVTAEYVLGADAETSAQADVWEFGSSADAYGAYTKDRPPEGADPLKLNDEAVIYEGSIYAWRGRFFFKAEPRKGTPPADAMKKLAEGIISAIKTPAGKKPAVVGLLPRTNLVPGTDLFFHQKLILDNIYLTEQPIEGNPLHLDEKTDAVAADYRAKGAEYPFKLLIVQYPDAATAGKAFEDFTALRKKWGEQPKVVEGIRVFRDEAKLFATLARKNRYLVGAFRSETEPPALVVVKEALSNIGG